ncbi:MAG: hypothetical protein LBS55_04045 [Prevotellaceae bacterium]|jgi:hypothetical protein|nr:hypothetical protein [Prevotellaceae bacterium]
MRTIKLIVFAIFSFAILNILNSCSGDSNNPEKWHAEDLKVLAKDWILVGPEDEIGSYYEYIFDNFPYVDGIINVYMYENFGTEWEKQFPLPYTHYGVDILGNNNERPYSIQYSYDIAVDGTIALKVHISDYYTSLFKPGTTYFRVAVIY